MAHISPSTDLSKIPLLPPLPEKESNFSNPSSLAPLADGIGGLIIAFETTIVVLRTYINVKAHHKLRIEDCIYHDMGHSIYQAYSWQIGLFGL